MLSVRHLESNFPNCVLFDVFFREEKGVMFFIFEMYKSFLVVCLSLVFRRVVPLLRLWEVTVLHYTFLFAFLLF